MKKKLQTIFILIVNIFLFAEDNFRVGFSINQKFWAGKQYLSGGGIEFTSFLPYTDYIGLETSKGKWNEKKDTFINEFGQTENIMLMNIKYYEKMYYYNISIKRKLWNKGFFVPICNLSFGLCHKVDYYNEYKIKETTNFFLHPEIGIRFRLFNNRFSFDTAYTVEQLGISKYYKKDYSYDKAKIINRIVILF